LGDGRDRVRTTWTVRSDPDTLRAAIHTRLGTLGWPITAHDPDTVVVRVPRSQSTGHSGGAMTIRITPCGSPQQGVRLTITSPAWKRPGAAEKALIAGIPGVAKPRTALPALVVASLSALLVGAATLGVFGAPSTWVDNGATGSANQFLVICAAGSLVIGMGIVGVFPPPPFSRGGWSALLVVLAAAGAGLTATAVDYAAERDWCQRYAPTDIFCSSSRAIYSIGSGLLPALLVAVCTATGLAISVNARRRRRLHLPRGSNR
jgi:hypothetical protein